MSIGEVTRGGRDANQERGGHRVGGEVHRLDAECKPEPPGCYALTA
jgi:hypothetical protein